MTTGVIVSQKRILVQDMYSIETLAHVDTLCLDKTGTITEGKMKVQKAIILHDKYEELFPQIIGSYLSESTDNNITMQAIRDHYEVSNRFGAKEVLAFLLNENGELLNFQKLGQFI